MFQTVNNNNGELSDPLQESTLQYILSCSYKNGVNLRHFVNYNVLNESSSVHNFLSSKCSFVSICTDMKCSQCSKHEQLYNNANSTRMLCKDKLVIGIDANNIVGLSSLDSTMTMYEYLSYHFANVQCLMQTCYNNTSHCDNIKRINDIDFIRINTKATTMLDDTCCEDQKAGGKQQKLLSSTKLLSPAELCYKQHSIDRRFGTIPWSSGSVFSARLKNTCPIDQVLMLLKAMGFEYGSSFVLSGLNTGNVDELALRKAMAKLFIINMHSSEVHQTKRDLLFEAPIIGTPRTFDSDMQIDCSSGIRPNLRLFKSVSSRTFIGKCLNGHVTNEYINSNIPRIPHYLSLDKTLLHDTIVSHLVNVNTTQSYCNARCNNGQVCGLDYQYDVKFVRDNPFVLPLFIASVNAQISKTALPHQLDALGNRFLLTSLILRDSEKEHFNSIIRISDKWYWYEGAASATFNYEQYYGNMIEINYDRFVIKSTFTLQAVVYVKTLNIPFTEHRRITINVKHTSNIQRRLDNGYNAFAQKAGATTNTNQNWHNDGWNYNSGGNKSSEFTPNNFVLTTSNRYAQLADLMSDDVVDSCDSISVKNAKLNYTHPVGGAAKKKTRRSKTKQGKNLQNITSLSCNSKLLYQKYKRFTLQDIDTIQNMYDDCQTIIRLCDDDNPDLPKHIVKLERLGERLDYCKTFKGTLLEAAQLKHQKKIEKIAAANAYASIANIHPVGILSSGIVRLDKDYIPNEVPGVEAVSDDMIVGSSDNAHSETVDEVLQSIIADRKHNLTKPPRVVTESQLDYNPATEFEVDDETEEFLAMYFHGDTSLIMTPEFVNDMAVKILVDYARNQMKAEQLSKLHLETTLDDIKLKIKHLCRSRRVGGPKLYNAITRLNVRYLQAHCQMCVNPNVITEEDREQSCVHQYGRQKCHSKHQDSQTHRSTMQYFTREHLALLQLAKPSDGAERTDKNSHANDLHDSLGINDVLIEDCAYDTDADDDDDNNDEMQTTGVTGVSDEQLRDAVMSASADDNDDDDSNIRFQSPIYRLCSDDCVIPHNWGLRLHYAFSQLKVENMGLVQLVEMAQTFLSCLQCDKAGPDKCPIDTCTDYIRVMRVLQVHYSGIRVLVRLAYEMQNVYIKLNAINSAFIDQSYSMLQKAFSCDYFHVSRQITAAESAALADRNKRHSVEAVELSFSPLLQQFAIDVGEKFYPKYTCKLCHRMRRKDQMFHRKITRKWMKTHNTVSKAVDIVLHKENSYVSYGKMFLCHDCRNCILKDKVPCFTSLNNFYLVPLPEELARLTMYELMLVTKVRSTMKIITLKNKSDKYFGGCTAVVGSTTHLPLELEDTLEHIATHLPSLEYMQFVLNALPNEIQQIIKQHLINFENVLAAVQWLVANNPLYQDVTQTTYEEFCEQVVDAARPLLEPVGMVVDDTDGNLTVKHLTRKEQSELDKRYGMQPTNFKTSLNNSFRELFQCQRIVADAIRSTDVNIDCLAFPSVFPYGKYGVRDPERLSNEEMRAIRQNSFYTALMQQRDPRVRLHKDFIFDAMLRKEQAQIGYGIWRLRNTGKFLGTEHFFQKITEKESLFDYDINQIQQCNRGSPAFWQVERRKLKTMDLEYGPSTFFITFSCAEYEWTDLKAYLNEVNPGCTHLNERQLVAKDPVSVMIFYMHRFDSLMRAIAPGLYKKKIAKPMEGILGIVEHYYYRLEFQARGAPHIHMKLWIKDAPLVGISDPKEIISFVDKYICCKMPDPDQELELYRLVKDHLIHTCKKNSCQVRAKSKRDDISTYCKSGFGNGGRPIVTESKLLPIKTVVRSRRKQPLKLTQIVRTIEERMVNDYNPACLLIWKANMDIQYIGEISQTINNYITGYITKHEQGSANDFLDKVDRTKSPTAILMSIAYHMNKCRELGIYEAIVRLLGLSYAGSDRPLAILTLGRRAERHCKLRSKEFLLTHKDNPDKSSICANLINQYYPNRPDSLSHLSLYEARSNWIIVKELPPSFIDPEGVDGPCLRIHTDSARTHVTVEDIVVNGHIFEECCEQEPNDDPSSSENEDVVINLDDGDFDFETNADDNNINDTFVPECHKFLYPFDGFPDNVGYYVKLRRPILVRYNDCATKTIEQIESYQFKMLQLYKPWHNEDMLMLPFSNIHDAFVDALNTYPAMKRSKESKDKYEELVEISKVMREEAEAESADEDEEMPPPSYDVHSRITELQDILTQCDPDAPVDDLINSLNVAQRRIFDNVMNSIDHSDTVHSNGPCDCSEQVPPIRLFVSGVAGTGKSHLIKALSSAIHHKYTKCKGDKPGVVIVAPTGLAAWNVDGVTIHRFFKLNVSHNGGEPMLSDLSGEDVATFTAAYSNIRLIIVDEISMISNIILAKIQMRLSCLFPPKPIPFSTSGNDNKYFNRHISFGGRNILMLGDLLQLPPIVSRNRIGYIFTRFKSRDKQIQDILGSIGCQDLWSQFDYDELTENMRQKDDKPFAELLESARLGCLNAEQIDMLQQRTLAAQGLQNSSEISSVARLFYKEHVKNNKAVALYGTTKDVDLFNSAMSFLYGFKRVVIDAVDKKKNHQHMPPTRKKNKKGRLPKERPLKTSETAGLQTKLIIGVGARVMLRRNLKPQIGLVNGSMGTVKKINFKSDGVSVDNILIDFDEVDGYQLIERFEADYERTRNSYNTRSQFPVILCYAMTIHKSQGLTLPVVYAELSRDIHAHSMAYVALSRTRKLEDLHLIGFDPHLVTVDSLCVSEIDKLRKSFNEANPTLKQLPYYMSLFNALPPGIPNKKVQRKQNYSLHQNFPSISEHVDPAIIPRGPKLLPQTTEQADFPSALTFTNDRPESCYVNAVMQLLLESKIFCSFMENQGQTQTGRTQEMIIEFNKLVVLERERPRHPVSVDAFRTLVHNDFIPTVAPQQPQQHSSFEFLTRLLDHFNDEDAQLWRIDEIQSTMWPCHNDINNVQTGHHALQVSDDDEFINCPKWSQLVSQQPQIGFELLPLTYCGTCNTPEDIIRYKQPFLNTSGEFIEGGQDKFLQFMLDNFGKQPTRRTVRSMHDQSRILFVDLPLMLNGIMLLNRKIKQRPAFNRYCFPAFPDSVFTLIGVVCRTGGSNSGHYFAYVRKGAVWFRLDCMAYPSVSVSNLPANLANVALMMFEKN